MSVGLERERETEQEMREWVSGYWLGEKEGGRPKEREIKWERENEKIKKKKTKYASTAQILRRLSITLF